VSGPQSSLARYAPLWAQEHREQGWELARAAWHTHGLVLLNLGDVEAKQGWVAARDARNLAERCYGKRDHSAALKKKAGS
jgi:hypothetical protein